MELAEKLRIAQQAVSDAEIDSDLRAIAFEKALSVVLNISRQPEDDESNPLGEHVDRSAFAPLRRLDDYLKVDQSITEQFFFDRNDEIRVNVPTQLLDRNRKNAVRQLALAAVASKHAEGAEWVSASVVRALCEDKSKFDSKSFSRELSAHSDALHIDSSKGGKQLKLKRSGWEELAELLREWRGSES